MIVQDAHNRKNLNASLAALAIVVSRLYESVRQPDVSSHAPSNVNYDNLKVAREKLHEAEKLLSWVVFEPKRRPCRRLPKAAKAS